MKWVLAALFVLILIAPAARADSIVFVKKGNIGRVDPDRARVKIVMRGRRAPFVTVSQADNGTMVERGRSFLRLPSNGRLLSAPIDADPRKLGPGGLRPARRQGRADRLIRGRRGREHRPPPSLSHWGPAG